MSKNNNESVSTIISIVVKYNRMKEYELWLTKIKSVLQQQKGFLGVEIIRPADITAPEYFILLRFENAMNLEEWRSSKVLAGLKNESKNFIVNTHKGESQYGTEMFFSRPLSNFYYPRPPFWKQVIVGIITVYPLILISSNLLGPITKNLLQPIALFLSICVVSPIMIFAMPKVSKLLKHWLYPVKNNI